MRCSCGVLLDKYLTKCCYEKIIKDIENIVVDVDDLKKAKEEIIEKILALSIDDENGLYTVQSFKNYIRKIKEELLK